ncbi:hypothetical protein [Streptomyces sp. NBC_01637]|uniref:hypothetical protein n=1 Tax=unclassified Streptomyces TaxID=2593676 RepID=UPI00386B248B|nr:hypothetical protein OH719_14170 [Streptomyces sp. NBC_01653]WTD91967.1 hypothetical protein OG891_32700 [Streptomyces sp. NBC_01637]
MDHYDSQRPCGRHRHTEDVTPIYDRLLAEWQAARRARQQPLPCPESDPPCAGRLVPAARTSGEMFGD